MPVLQFLENAAKGIVHPFSTLGSAALHTPEAIAREIQNKPIGDIQQSVFGTQDQGNIARQIVGDTSIAGLTAATGGISKAVEGAVPGLADLGGVTGTVARGAATGASVGGTFNALSSATQGENNPGKLTMSFLQGTAAGAALGGAAGAVGSVAKTLFTKEKLSKMATSENTAQIQKDLEPVTGPVVAQKLAPAITQSKDPEIVSNIIDNGLKQHLPSPAPVGADITPPSVSEPVNPGQGSEQVANGAVGKNVGGEIQLKKLVEAPGIGETTPNKLKGTYSVQHIDTNKIGFGASPDSPESTASALKAIREGKQLPPITVSKEISNTGPMGTPEVNYTVIDGNHRLNAYQKAGVQNIPVLVKENGNGSKILNPQDFYQGAVGKNVGGEAESYANTFGVSPEQATGDLQDIQSKEALKPSPSLPNPESLGRNAQNNPLLGKVDIPKVEQGTPEEVHAQAHLNAETVLRHEQAVGADALNAFHQLSARDQELMKAIETNPVNKVAQQADNPQAFKDAEAAIRNYYDLRHAYDTRLGIKVGYRQNYLRQILESKPINEDVYQTTGGNLTPGYSMERLNDTLNTDVGAALERDIRGSSYNHAKLTYQEGLGSGLPEGTFGTMRDALGNEQGPFQQLRTPYGNELSAQKDIAAAINKRSVATPTTGLLDKYDVANAFAKNTKLAGGGFHSVNVLGSYGGQQLASMFRGDISPLRALSDLSSVVKSTFSKDYFDRKMADYQSRGRDLDFSASGLTTTMKQVGADVDVKGGLGNLPVLKQIHDAIFGRQIPMLKMLSADQKFDALKLDRNNPADLAKMRDISGELNQNYGGMNRYIQGLPPETFKKAARVVLATDYNEGQIRSLVDAISKGGEAGKLAREVVFGKALLFGGIATGIGFAGGEFQGKNPEQVALDILQKVVNPTATFKGYNVGLPTTQLSELGKPISQTISAQVQGKGRGTPFENFASARLAAIPSTLEQYATNKNFYGQPMRGTDYYGRPVSGGEQVANLAGSLSPIPVSQAIQAGEGTQNAGSVAANIAGLRVTPQNSVEYSPVWGQTYLQALQKTPGIPKDQIQADQQFFAALGSVGGKSRTELKAEKALANDPQKSQQIINDYNQKLLKALAPWSKSEGSKYFDQTMASILQASLIKMSTVRSKAQYTGKTNPTSIGLPINALTGGTQ